MIRKHLCKVYLVFIGPVFFVISCKLSIEDVFLGDVDLLTVVNLKFSLVSIFIFGCLYLRKKFALLAVFIKGSYLAAVILGVADKFLCILLKVIVVFRQYLRILIEIVGSFGIVVGKQQLIGGVERFVYGQDCLFVGMIRPRKFLYIVLRFC